MVQFLKVLVFIAITIGFFSGFSYFGIPQIKPAPPPQEEKLDLGEMTMEGFVALGKRIVEGKGTCMLCHTATGGRAPLLDQIAVGAVERLAEPKYEGEAEDAAGYLMESMVDPSAYVVAGFGKAGSNDTVSPMPDVSGGGTGLSEAELTAVVAYLQDLAGTEITVEIPEDADDSAAAEAPEGEPRPPIEDVQAAIEEFGCAACHIIGEGEADIGPNLSQIGAARQRAEIRRAILDPNAEITEGFEKDMMPADYGEQMYAGELEMLVDYFAELK